MIDTIKIYTQINKHIYDYMTKKSNVKSKFNRETGELFYEIVQDDLKGSYDSNFMVRLLSGSKYGFVDSYSLELEGSYHKMMLGHNAYDGFYNLQLISSELIKLVEDKYQINLPTLDCWFLQRIDITLTFDLLQNTKVCNYINNLQFINYPRRDIKFYHDETLYVPGTTTTLKIYNKLLEFNNHDKAKLSKFDFDLFNFIHKIQGFVRFECEIKKKKLINIYKEQHIKIENVKYDDLKKVWSEEFMKLLKFSNNTDRVNRINTKEEVKKIIFEKYKNVKASRLYSFFITCISVGLEEAKATISKSAYYRNMSELKELGIDVSQTKFEDVLKVDFDGFVDFNPFTWEEVV